jgi:hypothetical protein
LIVNPSVIDANLARAVMAAGEASAKTDRMNCFVLGIAVAGFVGLALVVVYGSRSSLDWNSSVHLGAIPERAPQDRPPTSPVPYQKPMPASSDLVWRGCA